MIMMICVEWEYVWYSVRKWGDDDGGGGTRDVHIIVTLEHRYRYIDDGGMNTSEV